MAPSTGSNPWGTTAWHRALQQLLPEGWAWRRDSDAILTKLLDGFAVEHGRVVDRSLELLEQLDPRDAVELLGTWAAMLGLPSPCFPLETKGEALALATHRELTVSGGQSVEHFTARAAALGYEVDSIEDLDGARVGSMRCGDPLRGDQWTHTWQVNVPGTPTDYFRAGAGRAGQRLVTRHQFDLECVFHREKPAHTAVLFNYTE